VIIARRRRRNLTRALREAYASPLARDDAAVSIIATLPDRVGSVVAFAECLSVAAEFRAKLGRL
jgi:hypothetical protein